jgi:hypothetical protein
MLLTASASSFAVYARFLLYHEGRRLVEPLLHVLGGLQVLLPLYHDDPRAFLHLADICLGGRYGKASGHQEVPPETVTHLAGFTPLSDTVHIFEQYDLHVSPPTASL